MITVLIDNGHGSNTPGKCSPDGKLKEYAYCREIAKRIVDTLNLKGINAQRIVPEEADTSLGERVRRVNKICQEKGSLNVVLVSVHLNAAGSDGKWHNASGWTVWLATSHSKNTDKLADCLIKYGQNHKGNRAQIKNTAAFYIIKNTNCPAVLTENMFLDNKSDVEFLLSEEGKQAIVDIHVNGILDYINGKA